MNQQLLKILNYAIPESHFMDVNVNAFMVMYT